MSAVQFTPFPCSWGSAFQPREKGGHFANLHSSADDSVSRSRSTLLWQNLPGQFVHAMPLPTGIALLQR